MKRMKLFIATVCLLGSVLYLSASSYQTQNLYLLNMEEAVMDLSGSWLKSIKTRSLVSIIPFTAFMDGYSLTIQNSDPSCDITIQILDSYGATVFDEEISKEASSYITIPVDALPEGSYTLEIRNLSGGYVYGAFTKESDTY